ncbi:TSUP family transporter, partial [Nostoc sp. NIES-2111]
SILGIGLGWATASIVAEAWVTLLVGVIGLAYCMVNFWRRNAVIEPRPADVPRGLFWGTVTGFVSFVSHSGGPPFQVYVLPQRLPKMVFAGTSTILFAIVNAANSSLLGGGGCPTGDARITKGYLLPARRWKPCRPRRWSVTWHSVASRSMALRSTRTFWHATAALVPDNAVGTLRPPCSGEGI